MVPDLSLLLLFAHHMSYPTLHFSFCFSLISCVIASVRMVPTRGILGYFFAYVLGYRLVRNVPSGIVLALARRHDYLLLFGLAHTG